MTAQPSESISRRKAMQRVAMVGGAVLWAAPSVQILSTSAQAADVASVPPTGVEGVKHHHPGGGGTGVEGNKNGALPRTGAAVSPAVVAVAGAGLLAGGAAVHHLARKRTAEESTPDDETGQ